MSRKTRKLMWSVPLVAAVAVIGALAAFMTLSPGALFADTTKAPTELLVEPADGGAGRTTLMLSWTAPEVDADDPPITGYRIDESEDGQRWLHLENVAATPTEYTREGLKPSSERHYRVFAMSAAGISPVSADDKEITDAITPPTKVEELTATADGPTKIELAWDVPEDDGGADVIGYLIHFGEGDLSGSLPHDADDANDPIPPQSQEDEAGSADGIIAIDASETMYVHTGLMGGNTRHYRVYAVNKAQMKSNAQPDTQQATTDPAEPPSAPTGLTVVPVWDDDDGDNTVNMGDTVSVNLYWYYPASTGGAAITSYRVEVSRNGSLWPDATHTVTTGDNAVTLAADDIQVFIQQAGDAFGTANIAHQYQHTDMLYDLDGLDGAVVPPTADHPADPDEALHYRVFAVNSAGMGASSHDDTQKNRRQNTVDASMVNGQGEVPGMPTDVIWDDGGADDGAAAKADPPHYGEVNLAWTAPEDDPNGYRIDVAKGANQRWSELEDDTGDADPTYDHERWRPDAPVPQTYYYRIFSVDGGLIGLAHGIDNYAVDGQTAPTAVLDLEVDEAATTAGQISISWEAPENDGGTPITAYCILEKVGSAPFPATAALVDGACTEDEDGDLPSGTIRNEASKVGALTVAPPATELTRKNLTADETYKYKVYAVNDAEDSVGPPTVDPGEEFSTSAEERTEDTKEAVKAGAPSNLTAESAKDANFNVRSQLGVLLLWTGPEHPDGAKITGYSIERSMDGGTTWESLESHRSGDHTHFTDRSEPRDDEVRHYRVAAINSEGTGPWATMARFPMHDEPHGPRPTAVPGAVSGIPTATAGTDAGALTLSWDMVEGATRYYVFGLKRSDVETARSQGNFNGLAIVFEAADVSDMATPSHMMDMLASEEYIFTVIAGNSVGWAASWSAWTPGTPN